MQNPSQNYLAELTRNGSLKAHTSKKHGNKDQSEAASAEASSSETAGIDQTLGNSEDVSQSENLQSRSQLYDHLGIHEDLRPAALVRKVPTFSFSHFAQGVFHKDPQKAA